MVGHTPGPGISPAVFKLIQKVQSGVPPMVAWKHAGKPCSKSNLYKAVKNYVTPPAEPDETTAPSSAPPPPPPPPLESPKPPKPPYVLNSKQAEKVRVQKAEFWDAYVAAHRAATIEYSNSVATGKTMKVGHRARDIAAKHSEALIKSGSKHRITARALVDWHQKRKPPGAAPRKPGRQPDKKVEALVEVVKSHAKLQQLEGNSMKPRELTVLMKAATLGTPLAQKTQTEPQLQRLLARTRQGDNRLSSTVGESIAQNRSDWLTEGNVAHSFDGWEKFLLEKGFGEWKWHPTLKKKMIYVPAQKRPRIIQCDETHQIMTTELEKGGSRAHVYTDPNLGASGRATVTNSRHISGMYSINFAMEALPPFYWFDTGAKTSKKERVDASWVCGLPRVPGYFGFDRKVTLSPGYTINEKGGCIDDDFLEWIDKTVAIAYPNVSPTWQYDLSRPVDADGLHPIISGPVIIKTDYGPSRIAGGEDGLKKRKEYYEKGYLPYGSVPNGTAGTQELDDIYDEVKSGGRAQADAIVAERKKVASDERKAGRKPPPINLTNADLPRIVNGREGDAAKDRPFSWAFAKENIAATLDKLGYINSEGWVTRAAMNHPKVLAGAGCASDADASGAAPTRRSQRAVEQVEKHAVNLKMAAAVGLQCEVLEVIPKKPLKKKRTPLEVAPLTEAEQAFKKLKESGAAPSAVFMYANGKSMWAPEVLDAALEGVLEKKAKAEEVAASKDADFIKLQQNAKSLIEGAISFDALPNKDLVVIVRYLFTATSTSGVTKATKDRDAMLHNINLFSHAQLTELIDKPPRSTKTEIVGLPALKVPTDNALVTYTPFASTFGDVTCDLDGKTPIAPPMWLREALEFQNTCADKLLDLDILYRFEDSEGGWSVGTIKAINTDASRTVMVESDEGLSGELPANVEVYYESDGETVVHRLSLDNYAVNADSEVGDWALLTDASGRGKKGGRPALRALQTNQTPPSAAPLLQLMPPAMDVAALAPEQRRALLLQLTAMEA